MALQKTLTTKGIEANYRSIMNYSSNKALNTTNVTIRLYKDEATRTNDINAFLESWSVIVEWYDLNLDTIYLLIKESKTMRDEKVIGEDNEVSTTPFFSDAIDC